MLNLVNVRFSKLDLKRAISSEDGRFVIMRPKSDECFYLINLQSHYISEVID